MNLFTEQKETHILREWTCGYQGGKVGRRGKLGVWAWQALTAIFKIDDQQGPTVNIYIFFLKRSNQKVLYRK